MNKKSTTKKHRKDPIVEETTDSILIEETTADEVKALLAEEPNEEANQDTPAEASESPLSVLDGETGTTVKGSTEEGRISISMQSRTDLGKDKRDDLYAKSSFIDIPLTPNQVAITPEEKKTFLLAMLDSVPFSVTAVMGNGVEVEVRALDPYEEDLVYDAIEWYTREYPDVSPVLLPSYSQQFRMSMQITRFNGRPTDFLSYKYESGRRKEQAKELAEKSMVQFGSMNAVKYSLCVKAVAVFECKMKYLVEHILNKDFWVPGASN